MAGVAGKSGRKPADNRKSRTLPAVRVDETTYAAFTAAVAQEGADLVARGLEFTETDYMRQIVFQALRAKGLLPAPSDPAKPTKKGPKR